MRRLLAIALLIFLFTYTVNAEVLPNFLPRGYDQVILKFPGSGALIDWWMAVPSLTGGSKWYNLIRNNHGTLTNMGNTIASGWSPSSKLGWYAQVNFDSSNDYVATSLNGGFIATSIPYTICTWVYATGAGNNSGPIVTTILQVSPFDGIGMHWFGGQIMFRMIDTAGTVAGITATPTLALNTWNHVCVTSNGAGNSTGMAIYENGFAIATSVLDPGTPTTMTNRPWYFGAHYPSASGGGFQGALQDIKIFSRALTPAEIYGVHIHSLQGYAGLYDNPYYSTIASFLVSQTIINRRMIIE